ncbi:hypothetical protein [Terrabacter sp. C0L_2]|uniref:hypothetical protein n=1 Tax=Terrabacter sp. C0L_2 TaxID=3108389 RepID=UPI002ED0CA19|nr:hypothetical protein U5C87_04040 [Terrabacter sp. C0L_2]
MTDLSNRPAQLATELHRRGARFVVVGSAARWLTTGDGTPRDLDVAVCRDDLPVLATALAGLGVATTADRLGLAGQSHVDTSWGPLDVFVDDTTQPRVAKYDRGGRTWQLAVVPA